MFSLRLATYLLVAPTLAGILVIALLTAGMASGVAIAGAAVAGFIIAIPLAVILAARLADLVNPQPK